MTSDTTLSTDDESFIRTILDHPGDDLRRFVYADWLEERGDERGIYLRQEVEWEKTRDDDGAKCLRKMATDLDAVWVARVSRPPVGVCFSHASGKGHPQRIATRDLNDLEKRRGISLPAEYRAFLLNGNGGRYWELGFPSPYTSNSDCHLQHWFPIELVQVDGSSLSLEQEFESFQTEDRPELHSLLPVCAADPGYYTMLAIGITGNNSGKVYVVLTPELNEAPLCETQVAESLGRFLAVLYPIEPEIIYPD